MMLSQLTARKGLGPALTGTTSTGRALSRLRRSKAFHGRTITKCSSITCDPSAADDPVPVSEEHAAGHGPCTVAADWDVPASQVSQQPAPAPSIVTTARQAAALGILFVAACVLRPGQAHAARNMHRTAAAGTYATVDMKGQMQRQPQTLPVASLHSAATSAAVLPSVYPPGVIAKYKLLQLFSMPTYGKLLAVVAVAVPIVGLGGYLYRRAVGCSWSDALYKTYSVLNDCPGADATGESNRHAGLVVNMVYLCGLFTFAILLGIITDDISSAVQEVRQGNYPVAEARHTVVLGWNRQAVPMLRQMALAQTESGKQAFGTPVVLLTHRDKDDIDAQLADELDGVDLPVITRTGSVSRLEDLARVGASAARTVVVLRPEGSDAAADTQQAAALAALKTAGGAAAGQKVVLQGNGNADSDFHALRAAFAVVAPPAGCADIVPSSGSQRLSQLLAQVAMQPGLEDVINDLLSFEAGEGAEFYIKPCEQLQGRSYADARRSYERSVVVGILRSGGTLQLNPKDTETIGTGDKLVFVAKSARDVVQLQAPSEAAPPQQHIQQHGKDQHRRHILVLSFGSDLSHITRSLAEFCPQGSTVTVISSSAGKEELAVLRRHGIRTRLLVGSPSSESALRGSHLEGVDSVVLCGLNELEPGLADAQAVASVLQLQALAAKQPRKVKAPLSIVTSVHHPSTEDILWHTTLGFGSAQRQGQQAHVRLHVLNPDELMSGMLAQVAAEPQLNQIFSELFNRATDHELYLRSPARYGLPLNSPMTWQAVAEAARSSGETAIGLLPAGDQVPGVSGSGAAMELAPAAGREVVLQLGDKVVVLAAGF